MLLDTSVLIAAEGPRGIEAAISAASLAELHFGVLVADDDAERARRRAWRAAWVRHVQVVAAALAESFRAAFAGGWITPSGSPTP